LQEQLGAHEVYGVYEVYGLDRLYSSQKGEEKWKEDGAMVGVGWDCCHHGEVK
jgi:hypothetical protein